MPSPTARSGSRASEPPSVAQPVEHPEALNIDTEVVEPSHRKAIEAMARWSEETLAQAERSPDPGLVREGLRFFKELPQTAPACVLLATDLHAGNVLRARRAPWLVIDPKP